MKCLVIAASHRPGSLNRKLAAQCVRLLEAEGMEVMFPDYAAMDMPVYNDAKREAGQIPPVATALREQLKDIDGLVIATPEYNWSYPGSLKNIIDWLSHFSPGPLKGKVAFLMSASPSPRGGVMALAHLKLPLEALGVYVCPSAFTLGDAGRAFAEDGAFQQEERRQALVRMSADYLGFLKALRRPA